MKSKRRDLLKFTGMAGLTAAGVGVLKGFAAEPKIDYKSALDQKAHFQHFNMSGYAAPKIDVARIGFIGLGNRGPVHLGQVSILEGVDVKALCYLRPEKLELAQKRIQNAALWSSIGSLIEWSVSNQATIKIPDFTSGCWKANKPLDVAISEGGNTKVKV
jgi:hypothetical protein